MGPDSTCPRLNDFLIMGLGIQESVGMIFDRHFRHVPFQFPQGHPVLWAYRWAARANTPGKVRPAGLRSRPGRHGEGPRRQGRAHSGAPFGPPHQHDVVNPGRHQQGRLAESHRGRGAGRLKPVAGATWKGPVPRGQRLPGVAGLPRNRPDSSQKKGVNDLGSRPDFSIASRPASVNISRLVFGTRRIWSGRPQYRYLPHIPLLV